MTVSIDIPADAARLLAAPVNHLIDGADVASASGATFPTLDPSNGEVLAQVSTGTAEDVDLAVAAARRALRGPWKDMTPGERGKILWKIADLIEERTDEFAVLESLDTGKSVTIARAVDVPLVVEWFRYFAGWPSKLEGATIPVTAPAGPGKYHAYTRREPVGVVGAIIAWNFPLLLVSWKLAPALAAGNTVVLKPAEQTPLTASLFGQVLRDAGVPDGVVNIVHGDGPGVGAPLVAHPDVDKISFTGSTEVGKEIVRAAAGNLKKVTLELGGKSPNIIFADADLAEAIPGAANAIFFNQGEACTAGSRLFVHTDVYDEVVAGLAEIARGLKVGRGMDVDTVIGPVVSDQQLERVLGYLQSGADEGARVVTGGGRHGDVGYFVEPTILADTRPGMRVVDEEIFGPVLTVQRFESTEEVIEAANATAYGLAGGIWTKDLARAHAVAAELRAGSVWINSYNVLDPALPFGGYKQSGWGREHGVAVFDSYTETKTVVVPIPLH
ncbi:aldehyde dehydrogenase family protein [Gordonia sp. TBRC 11910]|uniref:Aldehyde dehydrogenase family protein n=1 Tax=Gordonia asplenii TaxID=2725283 RepID=A0A848LC11_9ACTN|nr:aldehyde dehydrogenase family protein [Gordonia asplenii]NMO05108.1 aldehyde dehydrogenase family protein [Gordonia asplenii]